MREKINHSIKHRKIHTLFYQKYQLTPWSTIKYLNLENNTLERAIHEKDTPEIPQYTKTN